MMSYKLFTCVFLNPLHLNIYVSPMTSINPCEDMIDAVCNMRYILATYKNGSCISILKFQKPYKRIKEEKRYILLRLLVVEDNFRSILMESKSSFVIRFLIRELVNEDNITQLIVNCGFEKDFGRIMLNVVASFRLLSSEEHKKLCGCLKEMFSAIQKVADVLPSFMSFVPELLDFSMTPVWSTRGPFPVDVNFYAFKDVLWDIFPFVFHIARKEERQDPSWRVYLEKIWKQVKIPVRKEQSWDVVIERIVEGAGDYWIQEDIVDDLVELANLIYGESVAENVAENDECRDLSLFIYVLILFRKSKDSWILDRIVMAFQDETRKGLRTQELLSYMLRRIPELFWTRDDSVDFARRLARVSKDHGYKVLLVAYEAINGKNFDKWFQLDLSDGILAWDESYVRILEKFLTSLGYRRGFECVEIFYAPLKSQLMKTQQQQVTDSNAYASVSRCFMKILSFKRGASEEDVNLLFFSPSTEIPYFISEYSVKIFDCFISFVSLSEETKSNILNTLLMNITGVVPSARSVRIMIKLMETTSQPLEEAMKILENLRTAKEADKQRKLSAPGFWHLFVVMAQRAITREVHEGLMDLLAYTILHCRDDFFDTLDSLGMRKMFMIISEAKLCSPLFWKEKCEQIKEDILGHLECSFLNQITLFNFLLILFAVDPEYPIKRLKYDYSDPNTFARLAYFIFLHSKNSDRLRMSDVHKVIRRVLRNPPESSDTFDTIEKNSLCLVDLIKEFSNDEKFKTSRGLLIEAVLKNPKLVGFGPTLMIQEVSSQEYARDYLLNIESWFYSSIDPKINERRLLYRQEHEEILDKIMRTFLVERVILDWRVVSFAASLFFLNRDVNGDSRDTSHSSFHILSLIALLLTCFV
jgi:hypothetical protein